MPWDPSTVLFPEDVLYVAVVALLLAYMLCVWLTHTHFGRIVVAVRENERRAELLGYDIRFNKLVLFAIGGGIARLAGMLFANGVGRVTPDVFSLYNAALAIIWVIVGGRGTLVGPILGAIVLFYLTTWLGTQSVINNNLVLGVVLIVFVLLVPRGIVPSVIQLWDRATSRRRSARREKRARRRGGRRAAAGNGEAAHGG